VSSGVHAVKTRWIGLLPDAMERFATVVESHRKLTVIAFSILYLTITCLIGATKPLWYDELWAYYPAALPTVGDTWNFFARGYDPHTPFAALAIRVSVAIFGHSELAIRLPDIFSFWLLCVSIYAFVSSRRSPSFAAAAMLFPLVAPFYYYATEAKDYGILIGSAGAALVCWQRASAETGRRLWWVVGLWVFAALTVCMHYFGIFFLLGLFAGEIAKAASRRRIDWLTACAVCLSALPLLIFLPMAHAARANYVGHYWNRPSLGDLQNTYRFLLETALFPLVAALVLWAIVQQLRRRADRTVLPPTPVHEVVAAAAIAALPLCVVPLSYFIGSFVPRYIIYTGVGLTISLALLAYCSSRNDRLLATSLIIVFVGWYVLKSPSVIRQNEATGNAPLFYRPHPFEDTAWMPLIERGELPVVISPAVFYLQFQYYALPDVKSRLVYLVSSEDSIKYTGANSDELNLQFLSRVVPLGVRAYAQFISHHSHFLLCADTTNSTWVIHKLTDQGAHLTLLTRQGSYFLFDVDTAPAGERG
jgi:Dolichyl-phosphate-mannose-protein mannosyltransferase